MSLETNLMEVKTMRIHRKSAILPIPIRFVRLLNWKPFMDLFMVRDNETLTLTDEKTFTTIKLNEKMKIYKIKLTGSANTKGLFNYRIMIPSGVLQSMNLK